MGAILLHCVGDDLMVQAGTVTTASVQDVIAPISHYGADTKALNVDAPIKYARLS